MRTFHDCLVFALPIIVGCAPACAVLVGPHFERRPLVRTSPDGTAASSYRSNKPAPLPMLGMKIPTLPERSPKCARRDRSGSSDVQGERAHLHAFVHPVWKSSRPSVSEKLCGSAFLPSSALDVEPERCWVLLETFLWRVVVRCGCLRIAPMRGRFYSKQN